MGDPVDLPCVWPEISLPFSHLKVHWTISSATSIHFRSNVLLLETRPDLTLRLLVGLPSSLLGFVVKLHTHMCPVPVHSATLTVYRLVQLKLHSPLCSHQVYCGPKECYAVLCGSPFEGIRWRNRVTSNCLITIYETTRRHVPQHRNTLFIFSGSCTCSQRLSVLGITELSSVAILHT
jgi:hypothetical protein